MKFFNSDHCLQMQAHSFNLFNVFLEHLIHLCVRPFSRIATTLIRKQTRNFLLEIFKDFCDPPLFCVKPLTPAPPEAVSLRSLTGTTEAGRSNSGEDYVGGTDIGRLASDNAHHSSGAACRIPSYSCLV
jgi:hypothetical protein